MPARKVTLTQPYESNYGFNAGIDTRTIATNFTL